MKRRRQILLGLLLVVLVAGSFLMPAVRWRVVGWIRGEAFFQGRPTLYWKREFVAFQAMVASPWAPPPTPSRFQEVVNWFQGKAQGFSESPGDLTSLHDRAAVPVLIDLLRDDTCWIRILAMEILGELGPEARAAFPFVVDVLNNADDWDRDYAIDALKEIDPEAAAKLGVR